MGFSGNAFPQETIPMVVILVIMPAGRMKQKSQAIIPKPTSHDCAPGQLAGWAPRWLPVQLPDVLDQLLLLLCCMRTTELGLLLGKLIIYLL